MQVSIGEQGLIKTHQAPFSKTVKCAHCFGDSTHAFTAHEGLSGSPKLDGSQNEGQGPAARVYHLHPNGGKGKLWPHDCCAVAIYLCRDCLEATAIFNQG